MSPVELAPLSSALVTVDSRALVTAESQTLATCTRTLAQTNKDVAKITQNKAGFPVTGFFAKWADAARKAGRDMEAPDTGMPVLCKGAGIIGVGATIGSVADVGALLGGVAGAGIVATLIAGGIASAYHVARLATKRPKQLIEESAVKPLVERFNAANGAERILLGVTLQRQMDDLQKRKSLTPEALQLLKTVDAEMRAMPEDAIKIATVMQELARLMALRSWTANIANAVKTQLASLPEESRTALADEIYAQRNGKDDHDARHILFTITSRGQNA